MSQADHRLSYVEDWANKRLKTLKICTKQPVKALDFSDARVALASPDRLEAILRYLSDDESWLQFETELGSSLVRVYNLQKD